MPDEAIRLQQEELARKRKRSQEAYTKFVIAKRKREEDEHFEDVQRLRKAGRIGQYEDRPMHISYYCHLPERVLELMGVPIYNLNIRDVPGYTHVRDERDCQDRYYQNAEPQGEVQMGWGRGQGYVVPRKEGALRSAHRRVVEKLKAQLQVLAGKL